MDYKVENDPDARLVDDGGIGSSEAFGGPMIKTKEGQVKIKTGKQAQRGTTKNRQPSEVKLPKSSQQSN